MSDQTPTLGDAIRDAFQDRTRPLGVLLDALADRADELEYDRDKYHGHLIAANRMNRTLLDQRNEARAQVEALERERDQWHESAEFAAERIDQVVRILEAVALGSTDADLVDRILCALDGAS